MSDETRDTLFGDLPPNQWPADSGSRGPWTSFVDAREALVGGDVTTASRLWRAIISTSGLESRHYLQAWHFLRGVGATPEEDAAKQVLGVVLEVPMNDGLDLLAAYADGTARYLNHSGGAVVWDRPDPTLDELVSALLAAGQAVVDQIAAWSGERPHPPNPGRVRLNFLTPSGLHLGEAPFGVLASDPMAGPVLAAGLALLDALTQAHDLLGDTPL